MLEKACTMKRLEYYPLDKELKAQTDIAKEQYQKLSNTLGFNKVINKENYSKSNVTYDANHTNIPVIVKNLITFLSNQIILF